MQVPAMYRLPTAAQAEPLDWDEIYGRCAECQKRYAVWYVAGDEIYGWCAQCHTRCAVAAGGDHGDGKQPLPADRRSRGERGPVPSREAPYRTLAASTAQAGEQIRRNDGKRNGC